MRYKTLRAICNRIFHKKEVELLLKEVHITPTGIDVTYATDAFNDVAIIFTQAFQEANAANYLELTIGDVAAMKRYVVTVRKLDGMAPSAVADIYRQALREIVSLYDTLEYSSEVKYATIARNALRKVDGNK